METILPCPFSGLLPAVTSDHRDQELVQCLACVGHVVPARVGVQVPVADLVIVPGHHGDDDDDTSDSDTTSSG